MYNKNEGANNSHACENGNFAVRASLERTHISRSLYYCISRNEVATCSHIIHNIFARRTRNVARAHLALSVRSEAIVVNAIVKKTPPSAPPPLPPSRRISVPHRFSSLTENYRV